MTEKKKTKSNETADASYLVLARKWRPQQFQEVVGQEPVVKTLQNAIAANRLAHAYLFCGMRGTGKTTTARIFAKAINCEKGPTPKPCDACDNCREIANGSSLDVIEIDGASNRGIDQIRDLRDNVKFAPSSCRFKVYIIDEVHMLTTEAFNALLKTLEEPPEHVKFFFATTEAHKVPATILSRCQRFDLKRIKTSDIVEHIKKLAEHEKVKVEEPALFTIAVQADGSLRDAISLLDQMIAYCDGKISEKEVITAFGLIEAEKYFDVVRAVHDNNGMRLFEIVDELIRSGKDLSLFLAGLLGHLRNLLIAKTLEKPDQILEVSQEQLAKVKEQTQMVAEHDLTTFIDLAAKGLADIRFALSKRVILEMCLVKMMQMQGGMPISEAIRKLEELERALEGGDPVPADASVPQKAMPTAHRSAVAEPPAKAKKPFRPQWQTAQEPEYNDDEEPGEEMLDEPMPQDAMPVVVDEEKRVQAEWPRVINAIGKIQPMLKSYLVQGNIQEVKNGKVVIGFDEQFSFHRESIDTQQNKELIENQLQAGLGKKYHVEFTEGETSADQSAAKKPKISLTKQKQEQLLNDPVVKKASSLFGGRIITIKGE